MFMRHRIEGPKNAMSFRKLNPTFLSVSATRLPRLIMVCAQLISLWLVQKRRCMCLALLALVPWAMADETSTKTQLLSRLKLDRQIIEASLEPIKKHLLELTMLEKQRSALRDYEGAMAVLKERKKVEAQLEQMDRLMVLILTREEAIQTAEMPDKISFPLAQAQLNGVTLESGELSGWNLPGASASWKLPSLPPGGYEVFIRYRCGPLEGGVLEVKESRFLLTSQIETTLKGPQQKNLGTLKITAGSGSLTLTGKTLLKGSLMDLLELWLVPANH